MLAAVEEVSPPEWRPRLRSLLGSFLFSGDDVFKLCRVLSGGERQRVALARILLEPANLLLLDEPTHHLDLAGKEVLEGALDQYPGAVAVVTHDRSLMARLATRIVEVDQGRVRLYPGGYEDYEAAHLARQREAGQSPTPGVSAAPGPRPRSRAARAGQSPAATAASPPAASSPEAGATPAGRRRRARPPRPEREAGRVEHEIEDRETKLRKLELRLADPELYHDGARARELVAEYERLRAEVESLWDRLAELD